MRRLAGGASHGKPVWQRGAKDASHPVEKINAQPPLYRFAAKGIGASMWFFVSAPEKKREEEDGWI